eukprot:3416734-Amphidinium_carterae.1
MARHLILNPQKWGVEMAKSANPFLNAMPLAALLSVCILSCSLMPKSHAKLRVPRAMLVPFTSAANSASPELSATVLCVDVDDRQR